jgi:hypothetical protein
VLVLAAAGGALAFHPRGSGPGAQPPQASGGSPSPVTVSAESGDELQSISCGSSDSCLAVGSRSAPGDPGSRRIVVETWNGSAWSIGPAPDSMTDAELTSVYCAAPTSCVAVGFDNNTGMPDGEHALGESWDGASWSAVPIAVTGRRSALRSVTCTSRTACVAVGFVTSDVTGHEATLVAAWDGTSASVVPSPTPGTDGWLNSVACSSASLCLAVGSYSNVDPTDEEPDTTTLVEVWNGTGWSVVPSPSPGTGGEGALLSVACASPWSCVAVGSYSPVNNPYVPDTRTLVEMWNGSSWSVANSPNPGKRDVLDSVVCMSSTSCTAVGSDTPTTGLATPQGLVETWDGTVWSVAAAVTEGLFTAQLSSLGCAAHTTCFVVGGNRIAPFNVTGGR